MRLKHVFLIIALSFFTLFIINLITLKEIQARPGGGHSYKKKSSSSNSNSSNSSNSNSSNSDYSYNTDDDEYSESYSSYGGESPYDWIGVLFVLTIICIPVLFVVIQHFIKKRKQISSIPTEEINRRKNKRLEKALNNLKKADPNFSKTVFLDFASSIYTKHKLWYGKKEFNNLRSYISNKEYELLTKKPVIYNNTEVVIGSIDISKIYLSAEKQQIVVEIDANYTSTNKQTGKNYRKMVVERWLFSRKAGILSLEPKKMRELACPNCGANAGFSDAGNCESCGNFIENGEMQWAIKKHNVLNLTTLKTFGLAHYEKERGTKNKTFFQPELESYTAKFAKNRKINWENWEKIFGVYVAGEYFKNIYAAWSVNKLEKVRNLLSDNLYTSFMFWLDAYKKEGLSNKLENIEIHKTEFVKMDIDKFYESATVRIYASCKDYVVDKRNKVKGGSRRKNRKFTEYWTFIRRAGVKKDTYDYNTCPNCGASADKMGQAGICEYCNSKISNGDFSWVLSIITQDEVYKG